MNEDPIVAEVRRIREQRARRFGFDIHKIFADIIARGRSTDELHPIAESAEAFAKDLLSVKEEPRDEGVE
jgi:hypothetical protein